MSKILVVDDEKVIREILADFLTLEGFEVVTAPDGKAAVQVLKDNHFNMVISDLKMPNMGGLELLEYIQENHDNLLTVIMTGFGTVETAIEAMKKGAYDYILKPFKVEEVVHIVHRGMEKQRLISENVRLKEILSLHQLSEELQSTLSLDEVIESILSALIKNLKCDAVGLYLRTKSTGQFTLQRQYIDPQSSADVMAAALDIPLVVNEVKKNRFILAQNEEAHRFFLVVPSNLSSLAVTPLVARQEEIGVLTAFSCTNGFHFTIGQRKMMDILGSRSAAAIDNAELYGGLKQSFRQTIQALARALEAMDTYTAGHSDRVTLYSRIVAKQLHVSEDDLEIITQAAMLHDIGKLGCHTNLNKPGKLTDEEYEIFKQHPAYGKEILEPIEFLNNVIPGVEYHHERWDGKGYPTGLKGTEIPLVARILSVADAYDAMTSDRAYRKALTHANAVDEIKKFSGYQFDPTTAEAFLEGIEAYRQDCVRRNIPIPK
ncbi:MAG: response regulator [Deltaproteobacteria bacterium]|nr:response regulator [Deltaproteobacteria bacterium]MBN2674355.1 response regulator [Deltaproteobacteria bacterium]